MKKKYDYKSAELYKIFLQTNNFNAIKSFLDIHGGINAVDESGRTALFECIVLFNSPDGKFDFANDHAKKLIDLGIDINKVDAKGYVALHQCILEKNYAIMDILLETPGIEIHTPQNLLQFALNRDTTNSSLMIRLIKLGLDPHEKDERGYSFFDIVKQFDDGTRTIGGNKMDVKAVMDFITPLARPSTPGNAD